MRAVIIAGGEIREPAFYQSVVLPEDYILCADSGYLNAKKMNLVPDMVIGDFDSSDRSGVPEQIPVRVLPTEKDRTDLHECIVQAIEMGAEEILLFGARGTRLDHSLAAVSLIYFGLTKNVTLRLIDEHNEMFMFNKEAVVPRREGYKLSLLPLTDVKGICTEGLYYSLAGGEMSWGNPYGVSNEFTAETAHITIESGIMMVILSRD